MYLSTKFETFKYPFICYTDSLIGLIKFLNREKTEVTLVNFRKCIRNAKYIEQKDILKELNAHNILVLNGKHFDELVLLELLFISKFSGYKLAVVYENSSKVLKCNFHYTYELSVNTYRIMLKNLYAYNMYIQCLKK